MLESKANAPPVVVVPKIDPELVRQQQARIDSLTAELSALKKGASVQATTAASLEAKEKALQVTQGEREREKER